MRRSEEMKAQQIEIPILKEQMLRIKIEGTTPLVVNKNHFTVTDPEGEGKKARKERNPEREFHDSIHWIDESKGTSGFPARGFKAACVSAGSILNAKDYKKNKVRAAFFIPADLIEIKGEPKMRRDVVRLRGLTPDKRFRAEYWPWKANIEILFAESILSIPQIMQLFTEAGSRVGVGEDRPEKGGSWGRFKVMSAEKYEAPA